MRVTVETIGNYDLIEKIAEGGMGTVYKARDKGSGTVVALKVVPPHMTSNSVLLRRFEQEYNAAKALDHPNVVRALDFDYHDGAPYMVMEFVEGESLGQRLERERRLPEVEAVRIISLVAQGLNKAHKGGLVHRDVKPDNILLTADGGAKLADMGLVKELETDLNLTRTGRGLGTPHFMAPEQFRNAKNADARCDIYSLAATLYMMLTGELPFKALGPLDAWMRKIDNKLTPARVLVPAVSERVDWAVRRAMSADPNQRPSTCWEFVEDLTGHSTRRLTTAELAEAQEVWYLMYTDDDGVLHTVKGTMAGVRSSLKDGVLGDAANVKASRAKSGPFQLLRNHPEFRDLVVSPAPLTPKPMSRTLPTPGQRPPSTGQTPAVARPPSRSRMSSQQLARPVLPASPLPPAIPTLAPAAPHIKLRSTGQEIGWLHWSVFFLLAVAAGVAGYYLMPLLVR